MKLYNVLIFSFCLSLLWACQPATEHPTGQVESEEIATKEIVMTTMLRDTSVIETYEQYHSAEGVWPEITAANQAAGIEEVKIYRQGLRLVMILTVPVNWDEEAANQAYADAGERIVEWGNIMDAMQAIPPMADEDAKWVSMKAIHAYKAEK